VFGSGLKYGILGVRLYKTISKSPLKFDSIYYKVPIQTHPNDQDYGCGTGNIQNRTSLHEV